MEIRAGPQGLIFFQRNQKGWIEDDARNYFTVRT